MLWISPRTRTRQVEQRPRGTIEGVPLLPPFAHAADGRRRVDVAGGREREIAILFADIRGFTSLAEGRLPYDVVFVLNRYFAAMGRAVETAGGRVDKFIGDAVNTASRLETLTKTYGCELVVSEETVLRAGLDLSAFPRYEIEIRGKRDMLAVRTVASASGLSAARAAAAARAEPVSV